MRHLPHLPQCSYGHGNNKFKLTLVYFPELHITSGFTISLDITIAVFVLVLQHNSVISIFPVSSQE